MEIISLKYARENGLEFYFTGKPCKNGHIVKRRASTRRCTECAAQWLEKNRERLSQYQKAQHMANKNERSKKNRERYLANREALLEKQKRYYRENKADRLDYHKRWSHQNRERSNQLSREWAKRNPDKKYAAWARRHAKKMRRTLEGFDSDISHIYQQASLLRHLGYDYHVDHIVPLQGENVSGLHVPWNLQVIPAEDNYAKGNQLLPEHALIIHE